jgi:hypothetical protein
VTAETVVWSDPLVGQETRKFYRVMLKE